MNGNTEEGEEHVDGALEGILSLLLAFIMAAILLALAFLGSWIIPIIMAACAIMIVVCIGVIVTRFGSWMEGIKEVFLESYENGEEIDWGALISAIFDSTIIIAFVVLSLAIAVLFLCLKAYTSVGSWVLDDAISLIISLVVMAFTTTISTTIPYVNELGECYKNLDKGFGFIFYGILNDEQKSKGDDFDKTVGILSLALGVGAALLAIFKGAKLGIKAAALDFALACASLILTGLGMLGIGYSDYKTNIWHQATYFFFVLGGLLTSILSLLFNPVGLNILKDLGVPIPGGDYEETRTDYVGMFLGIGSLFTSIMCLFKFKIDTDPS